MTTPDQFLKQTYALANHVPSVDLGAFDLTMDPAHHRLNVETRVCLELADPQSQLQLVKFGKQFSKLVPEVWSKKARLVCKKAGWDKVYVVPTFQVNVVGLANAHFRIKVDHEDETAHFQGPTAAVTEKQVLMTGGNSGFSPREGTFGSAAVMRGEIESYRRNIIFDLSKSPLVIPVKQGVSQDLVAQQRLAKFAREIAAFKVPKKFHSSKRPTLTVDGCGPGNRNVMAQTVAAYLKTLGVKNPMAISANGAASLPDGIQFSFDNAELKTLFPDNTASEKSLFQQITVAHEYGHMLGLPDEYLCMHNLTRDAMSTIYPMTKPELKTFEGSGMQIADVRKANDGTTVVPHVVRHQGAFVKLCHSANIVPPEFGRMTPSLMSNGMVLHPHHFVTLWEAVCEASGFDDWEVKIGDA